MAITGDKASSSALGNQSPRVSSGSLNPVAVHSTSGSPSRDSADTSTSLASPASTSVSAPAPATSSALSQNDSQDVPTESPTGLSGSDPTPTTSSANAANSEDAATTALTSKTSQNPAPGKHSRKAATKKAPKPKKMGASKSF